jgi:asparagine synthase (glutamine-hydrolysing)
MCGIIAYISNKHSITDAEFSKARDTLIHRGPDGAGAISFKDNQIALGHRRLSIIDLSDAATQPMPNEDKGIWLTFNGEIYNYQDIRRQLIERGHLFTSNSDTEVIIHGYEEYGVDILNKLKGMFAFVLYDKKKNIVFAARDRFGIKPLYFCHQNQRIVFASELKAIVDFNWFTKILNTDAVIDYFYYSYIPTPRTIWKDINKIAPGEYIIVDVNSLTYKTSKYWSLRESKNEKVEFETARIETQRLIQNSVKEHLVSDVPIGLFLSGGLDSGTLCKEMYNLGYPINSFSIGFKDWERSEHSQAESMARSFNTSHSTKIIDSFDWKLIDNLVYFLDEPYSYSSMIPYYEVSKSASGSNNKVVLVGDGGDEVFGGYSWYYNFYNFFEKIKNKNKIEFLYRKIFGFKKSEIVDYYEKNMPHGLMTLNNNITHLFHEDFIRLKADEKLSWSYNRHLLNNKISLKNLQYLDFNTFLPEAALTRADRMSMASSLEVRLPFLDHELVEWAWNLDESVYMKDGIKKPLLYYNLQDYIEKEVQQMPKRGFSFPYNIYMNFDSFNYDNSLIMQLGIINPKNKFHALSEQLKFSIIIFEKWLQKWIK